MPTSPTAKQIESAINSLISDSKPLWEELAGLSKKFADVSRLLNENLRATEALLKVYNSITGKRLNVTIPKAPALDPMITGTTKIGDAIERIILMAGAPITKDKIIERLREGGVRLSLKYPKAVLNTALKGDKEKRFKIREDGLIDLAYGETEKAIRKLHHEK